tara:strand:- start:25 stop:168 length:144 start_codon:yes stop_codon:yes gene_type:complete
MGITRTSGMKRMSANVGDIQYMMAKAVVKVIKIRIIEVEESDTMSSN